MKIEEHCGCGASTTVDVVENGFAERVTDHWRDHHRHIVNREPPYIPYPVAPPNPWPYGPTWVSSGTATSPTGCPYCTSPACTGHSVGVS